MKIAFFGSSLVSAYWNGAATYYRGILKALHKLGHSITFYEPDAYDRQLHRDIADPPYARSVVYDAHGEDGVREALRDARDADLLVKASGVGIFDELLERGVLEGRRPGQLVAFWDVDAPATLDRVRRDPDDHFRLLVPLYDLVLTYGGGPPVVDAYINLGARQCVPVYNALDLETHYPVDPDPRFEGMLGFVGNRMPDREDRVREFFLKPARLLPEQTMVLGGSGWSEAALPANVKYAGHVYTRDHNAFNCTPLAVLNVNRDSMARYGFSPPTRIFEAAGAGACLITDAWRGIDMFLEPDRECLVAQDGDDVARHLARLTPERARQIGSAARRRICAEHTYTHRARQLAELLA